MSAVNLFLFDNGITIWTDAAGYDAEGHLMEVGPKVGLLPHLSAVVASRGPAIATPLLAYHLGTRFETFGELVDGLGDAVGHVVDLYGDEFAACSHGGAFEMYLAGYRPEGPPEAYRVSSLDLDDVQRLGSINTAPGDPAIFDRMKLEYPGITDDWLGEPHIALRVMELQREMLRLQQVPGGENICGIGGFAQQTVLTRSGIGTYIMRRWPDRIGEPIGSVPEGPAISACFGGQTVAVQ